MGEKAPFRHPSPTNDKWSFIVTDHVKRRYRKGEFDPLDLEMLHDLNNVALSEPPLTTIQALMTLAPASIMVVMLVIT